MITRIVYRRRWATADADCIAGAAPFPGAFSADLGFIADDTEVPVLGPNIPRACMIFRRKIQRSELHE